MKSYTVPMAEHDFKIYGAARVGAKGQFVIPADAREELQLKEGDKLIIVGSPRGEFISVFKESTFRQFLSKLRTRLSHGMSMAQKLDDMEKTLADMEKTD